MYTTFYHTKCISNHIHVSIPLKWFNLHKLEIKVKTKYEVCVQAKQTRKSFKYVERKLLHLIHNNICDLNNIITHGGNIVIFNYLIDSKLKIYRTLIENQLENKIKILRSYRRGEFTLLTLRMNCTTNSKYKNF